MIGGAGASDVANSRIVLREHEVTPGSVTIKTTEPVNLDSGLGLLERVLWALFVCIPVASRARCLQVRAEWVGLSFGRRMNRSPSVANKIQRWR